MPWLLDTHVWIWSQLEPEKLGPTTIEILENADNVLYVATISTLELARLAKAGQVALKVGVQEWVEAANAELAAISVELTHRIAAEAYGLPEPFHRDPADRILVATAREYDLTLITADRRILNYVHSPTHDASR